MAFVLKIPKKFKSIMTTCKSIWMYLGLHINKKMQLINKMENDVKRNFCDLKVSYKVSISKNYRKAQTQSMFQTKFKLGMSQSATASDRLLTWHYSSYHIIEILCRIFHQLPLSSINLHIPKTEKYFTKYKRTFLDQRKHVQLQ
jgi:hypothetical protein